MKQILVLVIIFAGTAGYAQNRPVETVETQRRAAILITQAAIQLPGNAGRFDYIEVDLPKDRLLAAHSQAGTLTVLDLNTRTLISEISVGKVQGVAVDVATNSYVLGDSDQHKVVFVSRDSFKVTGEVPVNGPVDALDTKNSLVYADEDDGSHIWVVSEKERKIVGTILLPYSDHDHSFLKNFKFLGEEK